MVDIALRTSDAATMNAIMRGTYELLTGSTLGPDDPTPTQGRSQTGTEWFALVIGEIREPTGATTTDPFGNVVPVMAPRPGYHVMLRWNGGDEIPPVHPALEVVWRSDQVDANGNAVPIPAWWSTIIG